MARPWLIRVETSSILFPPHPLPVGKAHVQTSPSLRSISFNHSDSHAWNLPKLRSLGGSGVLCGDSSSIICSGISSLKIWSGIGINYSLPGVYPSEYLFAKALWERHAWMNTATQQTRTIGTICGWKKRIIQCGHCALLANLDLHSKTHVGYLYSPFAPFAEFLTLHLWRAGRKATERTAILLSLSLS